jgi:hypothetical protein
MESAALDALFLSNGFIKMVSVSATVFLDLRDSQGARERGRAEGNFGE